MVAPSGAGNTGTFAILFRYADTSNYWRIEIEKTGTNSVLKLIKRVAASETTIAETVINTSAGSVTTTIGISFLGDCIKVFGDLGLQENGLVFQTDDSDLNTNSTIGLLFGGSGFTFDDLAFWRGDLTLDLSVDTDFGMESAPLDQFTDTLTLTNQAIAHLVMSYLDIRNAFTEARQGMIAGVTVTLDALGTVNTALRVHGILIRTLPTDVLIRGQQTTSPTVESQQVVFR